MTGRPNTPGGQAGYDAILSAPATALIGFDYDGTLAPIVDDPSAAVPVPGAVEALQSLAEALGHVAIVTGRPAGQVVELAGLEKAAGWRNLAVLGHYGAERWEAGRITTIDPPPGLAAAHNEVESILESLGLADATIEDKGLSFAVHVRRTRDPEEAFTAIRTRLATVAADRDLAFEPGRMVVELRPRGIDKGIALSRLVKETAAEAVAFAGDDLGDLAAYDAVDALRATGTPSLLICSASAEVTELSSRADLVVDGPPGVVSFIAQLVDDLRRIG